MLFKHKSTQFAAYFKKMYNFNFLVHGFLWFFKCFFCPIFVPGSILKKKKWKFLDFVCQYFARG